MKIQVIAMLLLSGSAFSQKDTLQKPSVQVSFIYPLGTNGFKSPEMSNTFSFNVLGGLNGGVQGAEIGGIANINTGAVNGWQVAGVANVNKLETNGVVISGIANIIGDTASGLFVAGVSNVIGGNTSGMYVGGISNSNSGNLNGTQISGISNFSAGSVNGVQLSGISNTTFGNLNGTQISGISNFSAGSVNGVQLSGISNTTFGNLNGVQVGLINVARKTSGVQVGLINVSEEYTKGIPIGLLSFVKRGYHAVEFSTGDAIPLNANIKLGVDRFYNIYKFGVLPNKGNVGFTAGLGVGTRMILTDKFTLAFELSNSQVIKNYNDDGLEFLTQGNIHAQFNLGSFSFFAGPTVNMLTEADNNSTSRQINVPYTIYSHDWDYYQGKTSWWIGANAGIGFAF